MLKKLGKKLKKGLKKAGPAIALLGAAALAARKGRAAKAMQNSVTADVGRSQIPMADRMVQGLNYAPSDNYTDGINKIAAAGGVANLKKGGLVKKGKPRLAKRGWK
jgi:hypothetical protein